MTDMTQHVDEIARAVRRDKFERMSIGKHFDDSVAPSEPELLDARATMRAVVKQLREEVSRHSMIVNSYSTSGDYIRDFLDAYVKEANL